MALFTSPLLIVTRQGGRAYDSRSPELGYLDPG